MFVFCLWQPISAFIWELMLFCIHHIQISCFCDTRDVNAKCVVLRSHAPPCEHWVDGQTVCPPDPLDHNGGQHPANHTHCVTCSSHRHA